MPDMIALEQTIADLESQTSPNHYATAKKYNLNANTLKTRFTGNPALRFTAYVTATAGHVTCGRAGKCIETTTQCKIRTFFFIKRFNN